jgi:transmembrane sensor
VSSRARLDILEASPKVFTVALRRGRTRFEVKPNGPRVWRVECGPITIEVVGTSFQVERSPTSIRVSVTRGAVLVRGQEVKDRVQRLDAGQELTVILPRVGAASSELPPRSPSSRTAQNRSNEIVNKSEVSNTEASSSIKQDQVKSVISEPLSRVPSTEADTRISAAAGSAVSEWRQDARRRNWATAWRKLAQANLRRESENAKRVGDLLLMADVARLSGHNREAIIPLQRVVDKYASDARAALASFTLGIIRLDQLYEPANASRDLARAIELGLPSALAEDAQARLVEAYARAGDAERARESSREYRTRFPKGRREIEVNRWSPPD